MSFKSPTIARGLHVYEQNSDVVVLARSKYNLHLTKSVKATDDNGTIQSMTNIIWQSLKTPIQAFITWETEYAINWVANPPVVGSKVTLGGNWQPCKLGEIYDIDQNGLFVASQKPAKADWLSIGVNNYQYPTTPPTNIHVVIGQKITVLPGAAQWQTIFTDPAELFVAGTASYQPQEEVKMWYQTGMRTGEVYSTTSGQVNILDYTKPAPSTNSYEWWTTYQPALPAATQWDNSESSPPGLSTVTLLGNNIFAAAPDEYYFVDSFRWFLLSKVVNAARQSKAASALKEKLAKKYEKVEVSFLVKYTTEKGRELRISFGKRKPAIVEDLEETEHEAEQESLALAEDVVEGAKEPEFFAQIDADIASDIVACAAEGSFPAGTTGTPEN